MKHLTLGSFVCLSVSLGGIKKELSLHNLYQAAFFERKEDCDAFTSLCQEEFPDYCFFNGTYCGLFAVQFRYGK